MTDTSTLHEAAFLDALFAGPEHLDGVAAILKPPMFGDRVLRRVYEAALAVDGAELPLETPHVLEWLGANPRAGDPEWRSELRSLLTGEVRPTDIIERAETVLEHWRLRRIQEICQSGWARAQKAMALNAPALLEEIQADLFELERPGDGDVAEYTADKVATLVTQDVRHRASLAAEHRLPGLPTGYYVLDKYLAGWVPANVSVLKGPTGKGKTAFALNLAVRAARKQKKRVLVFSLEMDALTVGIRWIASEGQVSATSIRLADLGPDETQKFLHGAGRIRELGDWLVLIDAPNLTVASFQRIVRRYARSGPGIGLIILDYVQIMDAASDGRFGRNREQEVAALSAAIVGVARRRQTHALILSQINDDGATRESKRIAQDASCTMMIQPAAGEDEDADHVKYDLVIDKNRHGPLAKRGRVQFHFWKTHQRFEAIDPRFNEPEDGPPTF